MHIGDLERNKRETGGRRKALDCAAMELVKDCQARRICNPRPLIDPSFPSQSHKGEQEQGEDQQLWKENGIGEGD